MEENMDGTANVLTSVAAAALCDVFDAKTRCSMGLKRKQQELSIVIDESLAEADGQSQGHG